MGPDDVNLLNNWNLDYNCCYITWAYSPKGFSGGGSTSKEGKKAEKQVNKNYGLKFYIDTFIQLVHKINGKFGVKKFYEGYE